MPDDNAGLQIILGEAQRQLDNQGDALNALRTTTAAVVTGASVVAGAFGAVISVEKHRSGFSIGCEAAALVLFGLIILVAVGLLAPRLWHGEHELDDWIDRVENGGDASELTVAYNFATYLNRFRQQNDPILLDLHRSLRIVCLLLGLQVALWALAVL